MTGAALQRFTLPNGLRVVLAPEQGAGAVAVGVQYGVGFRSEPPGRAGFAHLMEHLAFHGATGPGGGGHTNAATRPDSTDFYQVAAGSALEPMLVTEADRMRGPLITEETLRNEKSVVAEEIRRNITGRPYGGFPKFALPPLLYRAYANSHDGYGDAARLGEVTVEQCQAFFESHYTPGNAVLTVAGGFDPDSARASAARHFGPLPARATAPPPDLHEPEPAGELSGEHLDPLAPLPAVCVAYRLPDPGTDLPGYLAHVLLAALLEQRLRDRLVRWEGTAVHVGAGCGLIGGPFAARHPVTLTCTVTHVRTPGAGHGAPGTTAALDAELTELADRGPAGEELLIAANRWVSGLLRSHDVLDTRLRSLGSFELLYGDAALHSRIPGLLTATTATGVADAARRLLGSGRAVLTLAPGGRPAGGGAVEAIRRPAAHGVGADA